MCAAQSSRRHRIPITAAAAIQAGIARDTKLLLACWLSAEEFGQFALVISISLLFASVANGGLQTYVARDSG